MLIVLSGISTVNKIFFARRILMEKVSNITLTRNYTMNFKNHPFDIYDPSGKLVYSHAENKITNELMVDLDNDGIIDPEGMEIFNEANDLYKQCMMYDLLESTYKNIFSDPWYDLGFTKTITAPMRNGRIVEYNVSNKHSYDDVLSKYNNRKFNIQVITGNFGKHFIEEIRKDLGQENVKVYNIIRNPSVAFLLNEKEPEYYKSQKSPRDLSMDRKILEKSILNAVIIKDVPGVTTIKYEDILTSGKFLFEGSEISAPEPLIEDDNNYLTTWELNNHVPLNIVNNQDIIKFNEHYESYVPGHSEFDSDGISLKYNKLIDVLISDDDVRSLFKDNAIDVVASFTKNIFTELGYSPLTYEEMTKPI